MKKLLALVSIFCSVAAYSQEEDSPADTKPVFWNKVFVGGALTLGFGTGVATIGGNPEIGYSVNDWVDIGIVGNVIYNSQRDPFTNDRFRQTQTGIGAFLRVYPIRQIFVAIQPETNNIRQKQIPNNAAGATVVDNFPSTSLIVGVGYAQRTVGASNFYMFLGTDLSKERNSPYRTLGGAAIPIFRSGFNIYLGRKSRG